jgi:hypothetical protein
MQQTHRFSMRRLIVAVFASPAAPGHGTSGIGVMIPDDSAHTAESSESSQSTSMVPFVIPIYALNMYWVKYTDILNISTPNALIK